MKRKVRIRFHSVVLVALMSGVFATGSLFTSAAEAEYNQCVDQPALSVLDPNEDGVLTLDELRDLTSKLPLNQDIRDLAKQAETGDVTGIRYDGQCQGIARDGIAVRGKDGESVKGEDGESVVGRPGESVVGGDGQSASGKPGQGGTSTDGQRGQATVGKPGKAVVGTPGKATSSVSGTSGSGEVCVPNPILALADKNNDGVVSIKEIDDIVELVGGNDDLETVRDQAVKEGLTGIRYTDCDPATPAASPTVATPVSSPVEGTPQASLTFSTKVVV